MSAIALAAAVALPALGLGQIGCRARAQEKTESSPAAKSPNRIERRGSPVEEIGWVTIRREDQLPDSLMAVKPENLPAHVRSLYRLHPDRRFLYAAAELRRLTAGPQAKGALAIRFEGNRWHVSLDGSPFGNLPESPGFADAKAFLAARLPSQAETQKSSGEDVLSDMNPAALESGLASDLFPELGRLNKTWAASPGDPAVAEAALRGLLWLALQTFDELELTDPILGKALALLVIAEAGRPGQLARQECLLADLLGYEDHAKLIAKELPADDPVRLYAEWDWTGLEKAAHGPKADPQTQYLYLLRLAQNQAKEARWSQEFEASSWGRAFNGPSLRLLLTLDSFDWGPTPATLMESEVLADLSVLPRRTGGPVLGDGHPTLRQLLMGGLEVLGLGKKPPESQLAEFEKAADAEASRLDGPLIDRQVFRGFRFANFYSSIYAAARYYFDGLSTTDGAETYGKSLENPPAGTAVELKDWILHRVALRRSMPDARAVAGDLSRLRHIGTAPLSRISYSVAISVTDETDPIRRAAVPAYFDRLDSRPSDLHAALRTASELLNDPGIMEQCARLAVERGPRQLQQDLPWALRFLGDSSRLKALTEDKSWPSNVRSSAIQELARLEKVKPATLVGQFRELIREDPTENRALFAAVGILEKQEQFDSASKLIDEWLTAHVDKDLKWAGAMSVKSRLLRKQRKFQEAWRYAEPAARTWKGDCLEEATLALIDLGRLDEALDMAKRFSDRYGADMGTAYVARVLWMKGKEDEAAQIINSNLKQLGGTDWSTYLPDAFKDASKKMDDARAVEAFSRLVVPQVPTANLIWFVEYLTANGRADLAEKLTERLRGREPSGWVTVAKYHAIRKSQSVEAARNWLRANGIPADTDAFAKQALINEDPEIVWDLPDHPDPTKNEVLNLIRAACLLYHRGPVEDRRAPLISYFESRPKKDFVTYGLFFLGQVDRPTLFAQIKDPTYICSVGWILGLTAAHEGRFEEADQWFQVSMETGAKIPPRTWSAAVLRRWKEEGRTLAEIARKNIY